LQSTKQREAKRLCDLLADEYFNYVKRTNVELPYLRELFEKGIHYYSRLITFYMVDIGLKEEEASVFRTTINNLKENILRSMNGLYSFKETTENMARMTTKLTKAKREMVATLENFAQELKSQINLLEQIDKKI